MLIWKSVNPLVAAAAGIAAFVAGGAYFAVASRFVPAVGAVPVSGLVVGLVTRMLVAYAIAVILASARLRGPLVGALVGGLAWLAFVVTILLAEGAFGQIGWTQIAAGAPEGLLGYTLMGAIVGTWALRPAGSPARR